MSRHLFKTHQTLSRHLARLSRHPFKTSFQDTSTPSQDTLKLSRRLFKTPFQDVISRHTNTLSRHLAKLSRHPFKTPLQDAISRHINTLSRHFAAIKTHQHPLKTLCSYQDVFSRHPFKTNIPSCMACTTSQHRTSTSWSTSNTARSLSTTSKKFVPFFGVEFDTCQDRIQVPSIFATLLVYKNASEAPLGSLVHNFED